MANARRHVAAEDVGQMKDVLAIDVSADVEGDVVNADLVYVKTH